MFVGTKRSSSPNSNSDRPKRARKTGNRSNDDQFHKLHELCSASYDSPYEYGNGSPAPKYTTFSEFMYLKYNEYLGLPMSSVRNMHNMLLLYYI